MEKRDTVCVQFTRGMAPAIAIAATVTACVKRGIEYKLITGKPAPDAKNEAAAFAHSTGRNLILCEDDFLAEPEMWEKAVNNDSEQVLVGSALMRNGELNCWFQGERLVYSGTVFVVIPWVALDAIGAPWFLARDLEFSGAGDGSWKDCGPNDDGHHSDTWLYYRCWESGIKPIVAGFVTHLSHPFNNAMRQLNIPNDIKPLGMMNCKKTVN
jgi:hypothetical protein